MRLPHLHSKLQSCRVARRCCKAAPACIAVAKPSPCCTHCPSCGSKGTRRPCCGCWRSAAGVLDPSGGLLLECWRAASQLPTSFPTSRPLLSSSASRLAAATMMAGGGKPVYTGSLREYLVWGSPRCCWNLVSSWIPGARSPPEGALCLGCCFSWHAASMRRHALCNSETVSEHLMAHRLVVVVLLFPLLLLLSQWRWTPQPAALPAGPECSIGARAQMVNAVLTATAAMECASAIIGAGVPQLTVDGRAVLLKWSFVHSGIRAAKGRRLGAGSVPGQRRTGQRWTGQW
eukprot:1159103-Pelagomonas_calceolata.AAC.3